jgi:hypothetical protein
MRALLPRYGQSAFPASAILFEKIGKKNCHDAKCGV